MRKVPVGSGRPVPVIVGADEGDLPVGSAHGKEELFALFGPDAEAGRGGHRARIGQRREDGKRERNDEPWPRQGLTKTGDRGEAPVRRRAKAEEEGKK